MTSGTEAAPAPGVIAGLAGRSAASVLRLLPAVAAALVVAVILVTHGTPVGAVLSVALYWAAVVVLPGVLLWRGVGVTAVSRLEDVGIGTALGLVVTTLLRWALSPLGLPDVAVVWSPLVVAAAIVLPTWRRRCWRYTGPSTGSVAGGWVVAAVVVLAAWWVAKDAFAVNPVAQVADLRGQYYAVAPYVDMNFQQALAWAVDRGWPPVYPYVPDVPLSYTLMVYEHLADVARWTGIDLTLVVMRLHTLPLVATTIVLSAALTRRLAGVAGAGALGAFLSTFAGPLALWAWTARPFLDGGALNLGTFRSPTQTFGEPIFLLLVSMTCMLVGPALRRPWRLAPLVLAAAFVAGGAKATFLPLLLCGLGLSFVACLVWGRSRSRLVATAALGVLVLGAAAAALLLVTGTNSRSLELGDGRQLISRMPLTETLGDAGSVAVLASMLVLMAASFLAAGAGTAVVVRLRRADPRTWVLLGIVVGGVAAALLGTHPGLSQLYFLRSAWPFVGILSAWGLAIGATRLVPAARRRPVVLGITLAAGIGAALLARLVSRAVDHGSPGLHGLLAVLVPWFVFLVLTGLVAAAVGRVALRWGFSDSTGARPVAAFIAVTMLVGGTLGPLAYDATLWRSDGSVSSNGPVIPEDGAYAARWIRDRSGIDDVVATNVHCLGRVADDGSCDARHFWMAALAERQVLVEGWSYANPSESVAPGFEDGDPFWDPALLALNDQAFTAPTEAVLDELYAEHGVRWLLVDRTRGMESPELATFADLVVDRPEAAVYQVTPPGSPEPG